MSEPLLSSGVSHGLAWSNYSDFVQPPESPQSCLQTRQAKATLALGGELLPSRPQGSVLLPLSGFPEIR